MNDAVNQEPRSNKVRILFTTVCAVLALATALFTPGKLHRWIHESFMPRVTSAHYEILFPSGAISQDAMSRFASQRESVFEALNRKLDDAASNDHLTLVFDSSSSTKAASSAHPYTVEGTTIRTNLIATSNGNIPRLDPAADAEALLHAAWGKPGNSQIGYWTSLWLVGEWHGQELGMAAAEVEQKVGYKNVAALLSQPVGAQQAGSQQARGMMAPQDRNLLAAAWLNEVAELSGPGQIHKLYSARLSKLDLAEVTAALGTTAPELERKWQLWLYAYVAGMPAGTHQMTMPMPAAK